MKITITIDDLPGCGIVPMTLLDEDLQLLRKRRLAWELIWERQQQERNKETVRMLEVWEHLNDGRTHL